MTFDNFEYVSNVFNNLLVQIDYFSFLLFDQYIILLIRYFSFNMSSLTPVQIYSDIQDTHNKIEKAEEKIKTIGRKIKDIAKNIQTTTNQKEIETQEEEKKTLEETLEEEKETLKTLKTKDNQLLELLKLLNQQSAGQLYIYLCDVFATIMLIFVFDISLTYHSFETPTLSIVYE